MVPEWHARPPRYPFSPMANRDDKGRFLPGGPGGPGRPSRVVERAYLDATIASVSLADWSAIVGRAVEQARDGDDRARAFLAKYLLPDRALDAREEPSAEVVFEVTIPAPRVGPHGDQAVDA